MSWENADYGLYCGRPAALGAFGRRLTRRNLQVSRPLSTDGGRPERCERDQARVFLAGLAEQVAEPLRSATVGPNVVGTDQAADLKMIYMLFYVPRGR
jgi:hypothetical protein